MRYILTLALAIGVLTGTVVKAQDAQFVPYRGGIAHGYATSTINTFTASGAISMYAPYTSTAVGHGYGADSLLSFNPRILMLAAAPFNGGAGHGFATDSVVSFNPRGFAAIYTPFTGGQAHGYASDSVFAFTPSYITMYGPFAGSLADGHHEVALCNYPLPAKDTTIWLKCITNTISLQQVLPSHNFAGRWNTSTPNAAAAGVYELRFNNAGKCLDTVLVTVALEIATWVGSQNTNWHLPANWSNNKVPDVNTHVIVNGGTANPCIIDQADAAAASVQVRNSGRITANNNRRLFISGSCAVLP